MLDIRDFKLSKNFQKKLKQKTGVHLRLGNGEPILKRKVFRKFPSEESFVEFFKIFLYENKFGIYVCSDTYSMITELKNNFGDLVTTYDRTYVGKGYGYGHNIGLFTKQCKINPYQTIYDAIYEMKLLGFLQNKFFIQVEILLGLLKKYII